MKLLHSTTAGLPPAGVAVEFPDHPHQLDLGWRRKRLLSPYRYTWEEGGTRYRMTAPVGFEHDGASIPPIVWSFIQPHEMDRAAVSHDLPYQRGGVFRPGEWERWDEDAARWVDVDRAMRRGESDRLFSRALGEDPRGPSWIEARLAYLAVRVRGGSSWAD